MPGLHSHIHGTAMGTLFLRASHQLLDAGPLILDDPVAPRLAGEDMFRYLQENPRKQRRMMARALRLQVVLRSRFAEDRLEEATRRGVRQYILLGAGFDTFAWRQPDWAQRLKIFEIDHPATQTQKKQRLKDAGLVQPPNLTFASIDFEQETLLNRLLDSGVALDQLSFFSWLGVAMYLREETVDTVLGTIAQFPRGSELVFTFAQPPEAFPFPERFFYYFLLKSMARRGEPFLSFFTPATAEMKLHQAGFQDVAFLSPEEARQRYFPESGKQQRMIRRSLIARATL